MHERLALEIELDAANSDRVRFKKLKAASDMLLIPDFWVVGSVFGQWRSKLRKQVHPSGVFVPWFITCWVEGFDSSRPIVQVSNSSCAWAAANAITVHQLIVFILKLLAVSSYNSASLKSMTVKPLNSSSSSQCDGNWNELFLLKKLGYSYTEAISFQLSYHTAEALE
ncbi:hypothetical protein ZIOFF_042256 [Zingiber officinale]|uniref:Uncharacterized protein n=1 Tax=Zingiber officinale TaxID=94328 RepID=A0A8J5GDR8_ZINOF|nr:hypothetical protein ZIOFF_042256 [Zingiber officinale]